MTQLEILKYAYVGALETVESLRKATIGDEESRKQRLEAADRDFREIRDKMFAAISEETGIDFEEEGEPMTFKIELEAGSVKQLYTSGLSEEQAERICNDHDWSFEDENGFVWEMGYTQE